MKTTLVFPQVFYTGLGNIHSSWFVFVAWNKGLAKETIPFMGQRLSPRVIKYNTNLLRNQVEYE